MVGNGPCRGAAWSRRVLGPPIILARPLNIASLSPGFLVADAHSSLPRLFLLYGVMASPSVHCLRTIILLGHSRPQARCCESHPASAHSNGSRGESRRDAGVAGRWTQRPSTSGWWSQIEVRETSLPRSALFLQSLLYCKHAHSFTPIVSRSPDSHSISAMEVVRESFSV